MSMAVETNLKMLNNLPLVQKLLSGAFRQKTRTNVMVADEKDGTDYPCLCERPIRGVLCRICGYYFTGHVRRTCELHKSSILLMDTDCCPSCYSVHIEEMVAFPKSAADTSRIDEDISKVVKTEKEDVWRLENISLDNGEVSTGEMQVCSKAVGLRAEFQSEASGKLDVETKEGKAELFEFDKRTQFGATSTTVKGRFLSDGKEVSELFLAERR